MLVVSRIEIVKEQVIDEDEQKRIELRRKKVSLGYKNVDGLLEQKLFSDERPKVALVFATTSITMADFNAGINAAKSAIDFLEFRVNFSSSNDFSILLAQLDSQGFDVIALVRGGGAKVEAADDWAVLENIVSLQTPIIAAIGHVEEKLFCIADDFCKFFDAMMEKYMLKSDYYCPLNKKKYITEQTYP